MPRVGAAAAAGPRGRRRGPPPPAVSQAGWRIGGFDTRDARRRRARHQRGDALRRRPPRTRAGSVASIHGAASAGRGSRCAERRQGELDRRRRRRTPYPIRLRQRVRSDPVGRAQTTGRVVRPEGTQPEGATRPARALPGASVRCRRSRRGARVARREADVGRGGARRVCALRREDGDFQL